MTTTIKINNVDITFDKLKLTKQEKEDTNKVKLYLSSIFKRSMPYLLLGENSNEWIFTNIPINEILVYQPDINHHIHYLNFKDTKILTIFTSIFPIMKDHILVIEPNKLLAIFNKVPLCYLSMEVDVTHMVNIKISMPDQTIIKVPCGEMISQSIIDAYLAIKQKIVSCETEAVTIEVPITSIERSGISFIEVNNNILKEGEKLRIQVLDGTTNVCLSEYHKRSKLDGKLYLYLWRERDVIYHYLFFDDPQITCMSVCNQMKWFPHFKNDIKK